MKKTILTTILSILAATASRAAIVGFGEDYTDGTVANVDYGTNWDEIDPGTHSVIIKSMTDTANDITFTVSLTQANSTLTNNLRSRGTFEDITVEGGGSDIRIDSRSAGDADDDEGIRIQLSLSGSGVASMTSLKMDRLNVRRLGNGETATFYDGIGGTGNSVTALGDYSDNLDYTGTVETNQSLAGLTALTLANVDSWVLEQWHHDDSDDGTAIGSIGFKYTVDTLENATPVADDQNLETITSLPLGITLSGSDFEDQALTYSILTFPSNGTLSGTTSNEMTYISDEGYTGPDGFTFSVTDPEGASDTGTVSIAVEPNYKYVQFEENLPGGTWGTDILNRNQHTVTSVITTNGITFSLTTEALEIVDGTDTGTGIMSGNDTPSTLGVNGGTKDHRMDVDSAGTRQEGIKLTLSVTVDSGFSLNELWLDNLELNTWGNETDAADFSDGMTTTNGIVPASSDDDFFNYTGNETARGNTGVNDMSQWGLVELSTNSAGGIGNGTWELTVIASGTPDASDFAIESIDFGFLVNALVNNPPVVENQSVSVAANNALDITLAAADAELLTFAILDGPMNGSLSELGNVTGGSADTTYTPDQNYIGSDSFTFTADDGSLTSTGTVSITVTPDYRIAGIGGRYTGTDGDLFDDNPDIDFASDWPVSDDLGSNFVISVTDTVNGIVFSLTLDSLENNTIASQGTIEDVGIVGGSKDYRIDPGEGAIRMTVDVSGPGADLLNSLELERLHVRRWGNGEGAVLSDGTASVTLYGDYTDYLNYSGTLDPDQNLSALTPLTEDNTGSWSLSLNSDGSSNVGIGSIGFRYSVKPGATTYALWTEGYTDIGDPNDDDDNDGMANMLEYALGGNPTLDDAEFLQPSLASDGNWFYYIHNERVNDSRLAYNVELKQDLMFDSTWETNGIEVVGTSAETGDFRSVTNRTDLNNVEFLQLRVERE